MVSPRPGPDVGDFRNFLEARRKFWGGVDRGVLAPANVAFKTPKTLSISIHHYQRATFSVLFLFLPAEYFPGTQFLVPMPFRRSTP